jgi:hypothetical protein
MLISLYPPAYSGAGTQAEHLVRALVAQGAEMKVLGSLPRGSDAQRCERSTNLEVRRFRTGAFCRSPWRGSSGARSW